ncbi:MAG TPA: alkaline phosphatase family protein [Nannocystaceae bacterium]|nr:alkaline phosphatase family protein [Nannocystaceae bacterium]
MKRTLVLDVVGLTPAMIGTKTPRLQAFANRGALKPLRTITPAVTCSVQASMLTGKLPREHGIVANGWFFRDLAQVWLWRQSNALVQRDMLWDEARKRDDRFTVAQLFWWYNMYAAVDHAVTPRPIYRADGRKLPDIHTTPGELRDELVGALGPFPLFDFWGPRAGIPSSQWIGRCAAHVWKTKTPTLSLVYLPHLDYDLQRFGPDDDRIELALGEIDEVAGELIDQAERDDARVIVLSEYGITNVTGPIHVNRALRRAGLIAFREELGEEHLDAGASQAFAVADHQIAHVYVRDAAKLAEVKALLEREDGIETVLDAEGKRALGLDHERSGELVCIARADRWFTYYWWLDDQRAPDYARTVDIHSKPGYDPCELFVDPNIPLPKLYLAGRLLRSKVLNLRTLMDVIPLDATLVKGSHGRPTDREEDGPVLLTNAPKLAGEAALAATDVRRLVLDHLFG